MLESRKSRSTVWAVVMNAMRSLSTVLAIGSYASLAGWLAPSLSSIISHGTYVLPLGLSGSSGLAEQYLPSMRETVVRLRWSSGTVFQDATHRIADFM